MHECLLVLGSGTCVRATGGATRVFWVHVRVLGRVSCRDWNLRSRACWGALGVCAMRAWGREGYSWRVALSEGDWIRVMRARCFIDILMIVYTGGVLGLAY